MKSKTAFFVLITVLMSIFATFAQAEQRLVLVEKFTNTSCGPCRIPNRVMDTLAANHPDVFVAVRYHVSWPSAYDPFYLFNPSENGVRTGYYHVNAVPHCQIDGVVDAISYWSTILARSNIDSPMRITLNGTFSDDARIGTINVSATALEQIAAEGLFLRIVVMESDIHWNAPNGLQEHNQVMRYMLPYSTGTYFEIENGETFSISEDFQCPLPIVPDNCEIVAWVQSDQTREVLQAARITVAELEAPSSINEIEVPANFSLQQNYPNPFNPSTAINYSIDKESHYELAVYNLLGHKVAELENGVLSPGTYQTIWNGTNDSGNPVSAGVYYYNLKSEGISQTKQMLFLK
jgi:hypothetical protein